MDGESLSDLFEDSDFGGTNMVSADDIFSILGAIESVPDFCPLQTPNDNEDVTKLVSQKSSSSILSAFQESENELEFAVSPKSKRQKFSIGSVSSDQEGNQDGDKVSHITVERNRRKQMNEHLTVLRSLMPCFYVKRGDQASIIGGVVDYINELQQLLQSLEAKKQRKSIYNEVLSPRVNVSSPRMALSSTLPLSPRKPPLSPRMSLPISPRTPQPSSPYKTKLPYSPSCSSSTNNCSSTINNNNNNDKKNNNNNIVMNELVANSKSAIADVEVKFTANSNVLLETISPRIPGQATKIISALKDLSLEIIQVNINTIDEKVLNSFIIKIGIECHLSAEELAHQIQQTFI